ncbi:MAG: peptidase M48 [Bacillota bacterium]
MPLPEEAPAPSAREAALRLWIERQSRLYRVAAPLLINNTELCPQHRRPILGFTAKNRYSFSGDFVEAAQSALGLGDELRVMDVLPGSGAEQAGMRKGDELIAVEIEPAPQGPDAEHAAAALIGEEMQDRDSLHLILRRDGQRMALDVPLTPACAMVLGLGNTEQARSFSDGRRVMVTSGMLNFVRSDEELAYVLAREIARNALMPDERTDMKLQIDRLHALDAREPDPLPPASAPPQADAVDRLALYMLARAGYDIDGFGPFGERLAAHVNGAEAARPDSGLDISPLAQAVREVKAKKADGLPLLP